MIYMHNAKGITDNIQKQQQGKKLLSSGCRTWLGIAKLAPPYRQHSRRCQHQQKRQDQQVLS